MEPPFFVRLTGVARGHCSKQGSPHDPWSHAVISAQREDQSAALRCPS